MVRWGKQNLENPMLDTLNLFLQGSGPLSLLAVFFGKLLEVTLSCLRNQLVVKGQRWQSAGVAFVEYLCWFLIAANVLTGNVTILRLALLAIAFSLGQVMGSIIEAHLALGTVMIQAIYMDSSHADQAEIALREAGYALSRLSACGREGETRPLLMLMVPRKRAKEVATILRSCDDRVMISTLAATSLMGGMLPAAHK